MSRIKTVSWSDVQAKRPVDNDVVAEHLARMEAEERTGSCKLKTRDPQRVAQKELADRMSLTQPTIGLEAASAVVNGSAGVGVGRRY